MIDLGASPAGGRVVTTARTVGIGLAVALVAASAGFFAGRAWTGSTSAVAGAPAATDVSSATDVSAGTTTTAPLVTALATSPAETASGSPGLVVTADESEAASGTTGAAPDGMPPVATAAMVPAPYLPGSYPSPYPYGEASATEPGELLGQRVTAEGTTLRAHLIRDPEGALAARSDGRPLAGAIQPATSSSVSPMRRSSLSAKVPGSRSRTARSPAQCSSPDSSRGSR